MSIKVPALHNWWGKRSNCRQPIIYTEMGRCVICHTPRHEEPYRGVFVVWMGDGKFANHLKKTEWKEFRQIRIDKEKWLYNEKVCL